MAVQAMASDERLGRAVPETNQALGRVATRPKRANKQSHCHRRHSAWRGNTVRDRAGVSRRHSRSARTEGPNIATTWRSRANLGIAIEPDRVR